MTNFFEDYRKKSLNPFRKAVIILLRLTGWTMTAFMVAFLIVGAFPFIIYAAVTKLIHVLATKYDVKTVKAWLDVADHEITKRAMKVFEIIYFA